LINWLKFVVNSSFVNNTVMSVHVHIALYSAQILNRSVMNGKKAWKVIRKVWVRWNPGRRVGHEVILRKWMTCWFCIGFVKIVN